MLIFGEPRQLDDGLPRKTEDDIQQELLGPRGVPGKRSQSKLTSSQQQMISQGLASSPSQFTPGGTQPQVGSKLPDSMNAQALPNNVTDRVPEVKSLLFVKLPDRIVLIDPDTKLVTEIVREPT